MTAAATAVAMVVAATTATVDVGGGAAVTATADATFPSGWVLYNQQHCRPAFTECLSVYLPSPPMTKTMETMRMMTMTPMMEMEMMNTNCNK